MLMSNDSSHSWNSLGINADTGVYKSTLQAYLAPYNDFGGSPPQTNIYKAAGAALTKLSTDTTLGAGSVRYATVSRPGGIDLYKNSQLIGSTSTPSGQSGYLALAEGLSNTASWDMIIVRKYVQTVPTSSFGTEETDIQLSPTSTPAMTITSTPVPSITPTTIPTRIPSPTVIPTRAPTPSPTHTPTPIPTKVPSPTPTSIPNGLTGNYYNSKTFTNLKMARIDPTINFNWGLSAPTNTMMVNTFSVRWTGKIVPTYSGTYTFYTKTDDGVRLWVNGVRLVNKWIDQSATEWSGTIHLTAGVKYSIKMEYYENLNSATAQLRWSGPNIAKQIIPQSSLLAQ